MLIEYVRKGNFNPNKKSINKGKFTSNREKKGVLIARLCEDQIVRIGWSLCNIKAGDMFNKRGMKIAIERTKKCSTNIPQSIQSQYIKFVKRAKKYYKDRIFETNIDQLLKSS